MLRARLIDPTKYPNPGGAADATLYEETAITLNGRGQNGERGFSRIRVSAYLSHAATLYCAVKLPGSSTYRVWNGSGSGEAISATTYFQRDVLLQPGANKIYITTGTVPTTWEVAAELIEDQALAQ
jgi:hypothetical protein